ncbi:MAG: sigma-70 family RNA polymerase sigma factor, partial [Chitinophagaceae bacterium]
MFVRNRMEDLFKIEPRIWDACKAGNKNAYSVIYTAWYPRLFNYGKKFTDDLQLIEDSIQEIFTRFWFQKQKLKSVHELQGYLLVSFRNQLLKSLQKAKSTKYSGTQLETQYFELEISVDQVMINADHMYEQKVNLRQALEKLTAHQKEAIFLKFYENLSYEEIANVFGISTKATYKLVA